MAQYFLEGQECISWVVDDYCLAAPILPLLGLGPTGQQRKPQERKEAGKGNTKKEA